MVVVRYLLPFISRHISIFGTGLDTSTEEILSLILMCILGVDLGLSISSVTSLLDTLERIESDFDETMENRYRPIGERQRALAGKIAGAGHVVAGKIGSASETAGEYRDAILTHTAKLTKRQVNALMNIEVFSSLRHRGIAGKMKEILRKDRQEK